MGACSEAMLCSRWPPASHSPAWACPGPQPCPCSLPGLSCSVPPLTWLPCSCLQPYRGGFRAFVSFSPLSCSHPSRWIWLVRGNLFSTWMAAQILLGSVELPEADAVDSCHKCIEFSHFFFISPSHGGVSPDLQRSLYHLYCSCLGCWLRYSEFLLCQYCWHSEMWRSPLVEPFGWLWFGVVFALLREQKGMFCG